MKKNKYIFLSLISIIIIGCGVPSNYKDICYVNDLEMPCEDADSYAKRIAYQNKNNTSTNTSQMSKTKNQILLDEINSFRANSVKVIDGNNSISVSPKTRILEEGNLKNVISNEKDNIKIEVSKEMNINIGGIIVSGKSEKLPSGLLMRVTKITDNSNNKILEGKAGLFMEAFPECKIIINQNSNSFNIKESFSNSNNLEASLTGEFDLSPFKIKNKGSIEIKNDLEINYSTKVDLSILNPFMEGEERMNIISKYIEIKKFYFNSSTEISNELELNLGAKSTKTLLKKEITKPIQKELIFWIGVVPIVFVTEYQPIFKLDGSFEIELNLFKHKYSNKSNHGFLYENNKLNLISNSETKENKFEGFFNDACGTLVTGFEFEAYVNHAVKFGVYGGYFFEMDLKFPDLDFKFNTKKIELTGGLEGGSKFILGTSFGIEKFFGMENFGELNIPFKAELKTNLYDKEWGNSCKTSSSSNTFIPNTPNTNTSPAKIDCSKLFTGGLSKSEELSCMNSVGIIDEKATPKNNNSSESKSNQLSQISITPTKNAGINTSISNNNCIDKTESIGTPGTSNYIPSTCKIRAEN